MKQDDQKTLADGLKESVFAMARRYEGLESAMERTRTSMLVRSGEFLTTTVDTGRSFYRVGPSQSVFDMTSTSDDAYYNESLEFGMGRVLVKCYLPGRFFSLHVSLDGEPLGFVVSSLHVIEMDNENQPAELADKVLKNACKLKRFYGKMRRLGFRENLEIKAFELDLTPGRKRRRLLLATPSDLRLAPEGLNSPVIGKTEKISNFEKAAARLVMGKLDQILLGADMGTVLAGFPGWLRAEMVELRK